MCFYFCQGIIRKVLRHLNLERDFFFSVWLIGRLFPAYGQAAYLPHASSLLFYPGAAPPLLLGFSLIGLAIVQTSCTAVVLSGHLWTAIVNPTS